MKSLRFIMTLVGCLVVFVGRAQTRQEIESDLIKSFKRLNHLILQKETDTTGTVMDSLFADNFDNKLTNYLEKYPSTSNKLFDSLNNAGLSIVGSDDGLIKFYTWDTGTGGQQHALTNLCEYKTANGTKLVANIGLQSHDEPAYIDGLYRLRVGDRSYYLTLWSNDYRERYRYCGVKIFSIEKEKLISDIKLIKTKSGLHGYLSCEYNIMDEEDYNMGVNFDPRKKVITLPLADENHHLTNKSVVYKFNGRYFERAKAEFNE